VKFINHIQPVAPRKAQSVVADVYAEARREFGRLPEPVSMLSPHEELLSAWWATLREILIAGTVPRARKEAVAAAVAVTQRCPWCVDAHTTMLYAAGESKTATAILADTTLSDADPIAPDVAWARGTATPGGPAAPFGAGDAVEYIGTAMIFHFVTRLVLVLLDETFLPGGPRAQSLMRRAAGMAFARARDRPSCVVPAFRRSRVGRGFRSGGERARCADS
jgi:AhpD family alkylhydroperoxidase